MLWMNFADGANQGIFYFIGNFVDFVGVFLKNIIHQLGVSARKQNLLKIFSLELLKELSLCTFFFFGVGLFIKRWIPEAVIYSDTRAVTKQ